MIHAVKIKCPICQRLIPDRFQEDHHLIPASICKRNKYAKLPQMEKGKEKITICICCGDMLHKLFTIKELAEKYNTLEKINANTDVQTWARWAFKKPYDFSICMKEKKGR
jgi:hypothetical protein